MNVADALFPAGMLVLVCYCLKINKHSINNELTKTHSGGLYVCRPICKFTHAYALIH